MVKCCSLIAVALMFSSFVQAQNLIPKIGLTYSKAFRDRGDLDFTSRKMNFASGLLAGVAIDIPATENLHLQSEILYIQKGHKVEEIGLNGSAYLKTQDYHLTFVEVPLLLRWAMSGRRVNLYVHSGVTLSYGLRGSVKSFMEMEYQSAWVKASSERTIRFGKFDEERPNDLYLDTPLDVGVQLGVGSLVLKTVQIEVRFTRGITEYQYSSDFKGYNQSLQITAGLPFTWTLADVGKLSRQRRRGH